jgi:hypothetical protein
MVDVGLVPCTTPLESPQSNGMVEASCAHQWIDRLSPMMLIRAALLGPRGDSFSATWTLTAAAGLSTRLSKPCDHTVGRDELSSGLRRAPAPLRAVVSAFVGVTPAGMVPSLNRPVNR